MNAINRVEYREDSVLIQINTKEEIENTVIRENSSRFRLAYSTLILEDGLYTELSLSGEGDLSKAILQTQQNLYELLEVQEIFALFHQSLHETIPSYIKTEQWIDHWTQANE